MNIDFTDWTDMQLDVASSPRMIASSPKNGPALLAEIARRKKVGVWMTDGSKERVEAMTRTVTKARRRKPRER